MPLIQHQPLFEHQEKHIEFFKNRSEILCTSDPGTGKTRSAIETISDELKRNPDLRVLVLAPLSTVISAWGDDFDKFARHIKYEIAFAKNRHQAFCNPEASIVITNHDAVKWIDKNWLQKGSEPLPFDFDWLIVDESTAFKNHTSQRTKALLLMAKEFGFKKKILMTGTPIPNSVTDVWSQAMVLDDGLRLGHQFYKFRAQHCNPQPVPGRPGIAQWRDKPGIEAQIWQNLSDITIRFKAEDCLDLPPIRVYTKNVRLPEETMEHYQELAREAWLAIGNKVVDAVHAASMLTKLLQICSGNVYTEAKSVAHVCQDRISLITSLIQERDHPTVVACVWQHQRQALELKCKKEKISFAYIDGSISPKMRGEIINNFQAEKIQCLAVQPKAASHGITLTAGRTVIWASPTHNAEHWEQLNKRIHRIGQRHKTEIIRIAALDTAEEGVYFKLQTKLDRMDDLLELFAESTRGVA